LGVPHKFLLHSHRCSCGVQPGTVCVAEGMPPVRSSNWFKATLTDHLSEILYHFSDTYVRKMILYF
jgi:hypothetical protein